MPNRVLDIKEAIKLNQLRHDAPQVNKWPEHDDLVLIAQAVGKRNLKVKLKDGNWYTIRYKSKYNAVFIKPENNDFVPCGYLSYDRLKQTLAAEEN